MALEDKRAAQAVIHTLQVLIQDNERRGFPECISALEYAIVAVAERDGVEVWKEEPSDDIDEYDPYKPNGYLWHVG